MKLPFWEDDLALWQINLQYVDRYVRHYYDSDAAVAADGALAAWVAALDRLLPSGLYDDRGYLTAGRPLTQATLARLCATYLHTSSATHDVVNNAVWDYSTLSYVVPTVVPESLEQQDVRLSFDLMNTIVGTWKPFNMLVDGVSALALDDGGPAHHGRLRDRLAGAAVRDGRRAPPTRADLPGTITAKDRRVGRDALGRLAELVDDVAAGAGLDEDELVQEISAKRRVR